MIHAPDAITELGPDEIIVVGTNMAGAHGGGAARMAHLQFGLEMGVAEGLSGQTYAFPTLGELLEKRTDAQLRTSVSKLWKFALDHPDKRLLLTKVGCGIAGYDERYMAALFVGAPKNLLQPEGWNDD